jgi:hypothetical protein
MECQLPQTIVATGFQLNSENVKVYGIGISTELNVYNYKLYFEPQWYIPGAIDCI